LKQGVTPAVRKKPLSALHKIWFITSFMSAQRSIPRLSAQAQQ